MATGRREPLPVLACVITALACAGTASCFSRGDLVLSTWGGDTFSTASLQLVVRTESQHHDSTSGAYIGS